MSLVSRVFVRCFSLTYVSLIVEEADFGVWLLQLFSSFIRLHIVSVILEVCDYLQSFPVLVYI